MNEKYCEYCDLTYNELGQVVHESDCVVYIRENPESIDPQDDNFIYDHPFSEDALQ